MAIKQFTSEEIKTLGQHPAVLKINEHFLHLTPEFKDWFYQEFRRGKSAKLILIEAGFDLNILPAPRIRSIRSHILKWKAEQPKPSSKFNSNPAVPGVYELAAANGKIDRLERELKRTKQELDFVKKIINASGEA